MFFAAQLEIEPMYTCHLCRVFCGVTIHVEMWRAPGVSVYTLPSIAVDFTFWQAKKKEHL